MVRETRHLWVGNLPESIREERVRDHFKRYGRVQSVKLVPGGTGSVSATVAFMDIKSAAKAHNAEHTLDEHLLSTEYYEPPAYSPGTQHSPVAPSAPSAPPVPPVPHPARFPLSATAEDHPAFDRTSHFYDRGTSTPVPVAGGSPLSVSGRSEVEFLRRPPVYLGLPEPLRGRPRERVYRNGPTTYPPGSDRSSTGSQRRSWQLDLASGPRFPPEGESAGSVCSVGKRKLSGSESRSGSQSSRSRSPVRSPVRSPIRSPVRSPTHSSSASTRSSGSSERSTSPGDGKVRLALQSAVTPSSCVVSAGAAASAAATLSVYSDDRRPLAICVRDLPTRSSDTSLKDGLFHEYKKHGKVTWVKVVGSANDRYALVCFKKPEDVQKAIEVSQDKFFFGCKIDVAPYHGYDVEDNEARPYDTELDEYHPKATRTLFIGNLEKDISAQDIRQAFDQFGEIIEIDVKKQSGVALSYAFCQYADIASVVQAMRTLDGELLGESRLKLGFGKSMASSCVWVAGVADQVSEKYLDLQFRKFGLLSQVVVDRSRGQALVFFDQVPSAAAAVKEMRGVTLRGRRIQIDFASRECQEAFFERIEAQRESWATADGLETARARYDAPRVRSSSYSRSSGGRTPRRHDVVNESPRYRSFEDLSPGSDYEELASGEQTDLNHLHKRRDQIQKLLRLDTRDKEKGRPTRSVTAADQGLVVTTHNHRRRLSSHRRSSGEGPAPLSKRRKTGSTSEDERRRHHHHSGDESRPGTPLIDELPDQRPKEPRKIPMKRPEEPLSLPLPEFAAHCFPNVRTGIGSVPLSPPRSASPPLVPPMSPARPPSPLSNSSSEISPQSPTLEERIRSLDEKYEQWSGRTQPVVTKPRHHLLEVDVRELQPSDIVKSVLSRPSVFDEDSKRLENVNEKYEPRDFSTYQRPTGIAPGDPRSACFLPVSVRVSPHGSPSPAVLSPAAKGLQYPFPSHPPVLPTTSVATTTAGSLSPPIRTMSKSMEFSVLKAESWLGINRNAESNALGFSHRFLASGLRHKPADLPKVESRVGPSDGKPSDPRLDKASGPLTPVTPVTPVTPATPTTPATPVFPHRVVSRLCDGEWTKVERLSVSATKPPELAPVPVPVPEPIKPVVKSIRSRIETVTEPTPEAPKPPPGRRPESVELSHVTPNDRSMCADSAELSKEIALKSVQTVVDKSVNSALDKPCIAQESNKISDKADSCRLSGRDALTARVGSVTHESESTKKLDNSVIKPNHYQCKSVNNAPSPTDPKLPTSAPPPVALTSSPTQSTPSVTTSAPTPPTPPAPSVTTPVPAPPAPSGMTAPPPAAPPALSPNTRPVISDVTPSTKSAVSKLNEPVSREGVTKIVVKPDNGLTAHAQIRELIPPKAVSEYVPFNIRDKESGTWNAERAKICIKEKEKSRDEKEKPIHINRDNEKDRHKERLMSEKEREKERDRHKSLSRDKTKDREISETVDKERKKDRDVEIDRKKDRESMEIIEREKRKVSSDAKNAELEVDGKKEHLDTLDRRKCSGDKRSEHQERKSSDQSDKAKRKEGDKEKRRDGGHEKDRKKEHSSDKHRKTSEDKKREDEADKSRDKHRDKIGGGSGSGSVASGPVPAPAAIGTKRRISSADSVQGEEAKRAKVDLKRRDSRDSRSSASSKRSDTKETKPSDPKLSQSKPPENSEQRPDSKPIECRRKEEGEKKKHCSESVDKSRTKDINKKIKVKIEREEVRSVRDYNGKSVKDNHDKHKELSSDTDDEKRHNNNRKDGKEKKRPFGSSESLDEKIVIKKEKTPISDRRREGESPEERLQKENPNPKSEIRRENGIMESCTDSDSEPKKHSIFDVVLDDSPYISMYDKVKARSTKNLQKQEEEKRQVKLKEKFSALKQSRAKREEKKRSTSWDEDSDSDASLRRPRQRRFSRLSSDDENRRKDARDVRDIRLDSSSEDTLRERPRTGRLRAAEIYTDDDSDTVEKTKLFIKTKTNEEDSEKKILVNSVKPFAQVANNTNQVPNSKRDKISPDNNKLCKVRLSLDSSTERFANKKRPSNDTMSESEHNYLSLAKNNEKTERKKSKKKEKHQKWSDDEKACDGEQNDIKLMNERLERKKLEKKERRKSIQMGCDGHDENKLKRRTPMLTAHIAHIDRDDNKLEEMFGSCEDSDQSQHKTDASGKSIQSKWHVDEIYNSEDSDVDSMPTLMEARKVKEKKKKDKKNREPCKEVIQVGQALEARLGFGHQDSDEIVKGDLEMKIKVAKEKKKRRKKSKDEKSSRHHHHHYHHENREGRDHRDNHDTHHHHDHHEKAEKIEKSLDAQPSMPSLVDAPSPPAPARPLTPSPNLAMPVLTKPARKDKIPLFGCENDEMQHDTAVQSISHPETPKVKKVASPVPEERDNAKERTIISQEETEVAVAALLGETFSFGSCYSGSPPAEPEPAPHDEEEMRQAVQSLNSDAKPATPQSDTDLQIDTDAEDGEEFSGGRFDFIPRTPDAELGPPKTPDISPAFQNKPFVRKDTTRNSRDDMELPIGETPLSSFSPHEAERKPPVLTPPSPKLTFQEEPPAIEPQVKRIPENRLLLAPPPLVPVSKQVPPSPPRPGSNIALVHPMISLSSSSSPATLMLTPIRTTASGPVHSTPLPRKTYTLSPPGGLISTRVSIPPPVLSPVTPSVTTAPKLPTSSSSLTQLSTRFSSPTTIMSTRQLPTHLVSQTIVVSAPGATLASNRSAVSPPDRTRIQHMPSLTPSETSPPPPLTQQVRARQISQGAGAPLPHVQATTPVIAHAPAERQGVVQALPPPVVQKAVVSRSTSTTQKATSPPQIPVSHPPAVHHSVQSIIQSKPVITTVNVPTLQIAHKSVISPTTVVTETPTVLTSIGNVEPKNLGVSVICQKPTVEKHVPRIDNIDLGSDVKDNKPQIVQNMADEKKIITEINEEKEENKVEKELVDHKYVENPVVKLSINEEVETKKPCPNEALLSDLSVKAEIPVENHVAESVIKRVECHEKSDLSFDKSPEGVISNPTSDSKDGSSDDDKPINAIARKGRKKAGRGAASARRGQRVAGKGGAPLPAPDSPVAAPTPTRRSGRGRGARAGADGGRKLAADVYEFHDESDDEGGDDQERPRLVITIKSPNNSKETPVVATKASSVSPKETPAKQAKSPPVVKVKEATPEPQKTPAVEIASNNTRKSRRLLEKDGSRNTVDEVIEDVIRSVNLRASPRRSMRQVAPVKPPMAPPPPKKVRGKKTAADDDIKSEESPKTPETPETPETDELHLEETKDASVITRPVEEISETSDEEPTTLIDPVTGMLMVMRAKEGGKYVPVPGEPPTVPAVPSQLASPPDVAPDGPPTPPPPAPALAVATGNTPAKPYSPSPKHEPIVSEGLATHWLGQAQTAKTVVKALTDKSPAPFMSCRPPTPPTTPLAMQGPTPLIIQSSGSHPAPLTIQGPDPQLAPLSKPHAVPPSKLEATAQVTPPKIQSSSPHPQQLTILGGASAALSVQASAPHQSPMIVKGSAPVNTPLTIHPVMLPTSLTIHPTPMTIHGPAAPLAVHGASPISPQLLHKDPPLRPVNRPLEKPKTIEPSHPKPLIPPDPIRAEPKVVIYPDEYMKSGLVSRASSPKSIAISSKPTYTNARNVPLLYPNVRCVQPGVKGVVDVIPAQQVYGPARCLNPGMKAGVVGVASSPPIHDLLPMTGAVASPPPRAPHFASQQPVVAGASSSRSLGDSVKGPRASPRPLALVPTFEGAMLKSGRNGQSPPPAHQQGEAVSLGHLGPFVHPQFVYQPYMSGMLAAPYRMSASIEERAAGDLGLSPPIELRRPNEPVYMGKYYDEPPPAHLHQRQGPMAVPTQPLQPIQQAEAPSQPQPRMQVATPPHGSQVPIPQTSPATVSLEKLNRLLQSDYPIMWQGLLALKNDKSSVQMHFVLGNVEVARECLRPNSDGFTSSLRISQRMRLEHNQLEGVARKMQIENEHCMLVALPCGLDPIDLFKQSTNLESAFIHYLQQKQAAGIVNVVVNPRIAKSPAFVVHIFPSCDFANEYVIRAAPELANQIRPIPHLLIIIATV